MASVAAQLRGFERLEFFAVLGMMPYRNLYYGTVNERNSFRQNVKKRRYPTLGEENNNKKEILYYRVIFLLNPQKFLFKLRHLGKFLWGLLGIFYSKNLRKLQFKLNHPVVTRLHDPTHSPLSHQLPHIPPSCLIPLIHLLNCLTDPRLFYKQCGN